MGASMWAALLQPWVSHLPASGAGGVRAGVPAAVPGASRPHGALQAVLQLHAGHILCMLH